ncbi:MAG: hypothetical protein R2701_07015 [Acidimicrobiales bacterium]
MEGNLALGTPTGSARKRRTFSPFVMVIAIARARRRLEAAHARPHGRGARRLAIVLGGRHDDDDGHDHLAGGLGAASRQSASGYRRARSSLVHRLMAELAPWTRHLPTGTDPSSLDLPPARCRSLGRGQAVGRPLPGAPAVLTTAPAGSPAPSWRSGRARRPGAWLALAWGQVIGSSSRGQLVDLVVAHVGALRLGAVVVPASTASLPRSSPTSSTMLARSWPWSTGPMPARTIGELDPSIVVTAPRSPRRSAAVRGACADVASSTDPALLACTSGTTGTPKRLRCSPTATCWRRPRRCASPGDGPR